MICATGSQAFCPEIDKKPVSRSLIFPWIWVLYIFPSSIQLPPMAIDATDWDEGYVGIDGSRIRVVSKNCGKDVTGRGQIQQGFRRHFCKQDEDSLRILEGKLRQYSIASYDCCIYLPQKYKKIRSLLKYLSSQHLCVLFSSMVVQPPAFHEDQAMYSSATK